LAFSLLRRYISCSTGPGAWLRRRSRIQLYYGFVGVVLVWQFVYCTIATDPARFRPMMILSALAKGSFVGALLVLYLQHRISPLEAATGLPDALLIGLFMAAYWKTRPLF
jgi:hypothetical protein